jgi:hypothetical protein
MVVANSNPKLRVIERMDKLLPVDGRLLGFSSARGRAGQDAVPAFWLPDAGRGGFDPTRHSLVK